MVDIEVNGGDHAVIGKGMQEEENNVSGVVYQFFDFLENDSEPLFASFGDVRHEIVEVPSAARLLVASCMVYKCYVKEIENLLEQMIAINREKPHCDSCHGEHTGEPKFLQMLPSANCLASYVEPCSLINQSYEHSHLSFANLLITHMQTLSVLLATKLIYRIPNHYCLSCRT